MKTGFALPQSFSANWDIDLTKSLRANAGGRTPQDFYQVRRALNMIRCSWDRLSSPPILYSPWSYLERLCLAGRIQYQNDVLVQLAAWPERDFCILGAMLFVDGIDGIVSPASLVRGVEGIVGKPLAIYLLHHASDMLDDADDSVKGLSFKVLARVLPTLTEAVRSRWLYLLLQMLVSEQRGQALGAHYVFDHLLDALSYEELKSFGEILDIFVLSSPESEILKDLSFRVQAHTFLKQRFSISVFERSVYRM